MAVAITSSSSNPISGQPASGNIAQYSSVNIGTAAADRIVVVGVTMELSGAPRPSVTIDYGSGDTTMAFDPTFGDALQGAVSVDMYWLPVPTGTTATIKVTVAGFNPTAAQNHIIVHTVTGANFSPSIVGAMADTDGDPISSAAAGSPFLLPTIPTNGAAVFYFAGASDITTRTWTGTGVTENTANDVASASGGFRAGSAIGTTAGTPTVTVSGINNEDTVLAWLTFAPAASIFGDCKGSVLYAINGPTDPQALSRPLYVEVGDLLSVIVVQETSAQTISAITDNLGNSLSALQSGTNTYQVSTFQGLCTVAGQSIASVDFSAAYSGHLTVIYAAHKGPFAASPLDANPAALADVASPYACNATGTLAQADELILGLFGGEHASGTYSSPTPSARIDQQGTDTNTGACLTALVVSSTSTVQMGVSATIGAKEVCIAASFKKFSGNPDLSPGADALALSTTAPAKVTDNIDTPTDAALALSGPAPTRAIGLAFIPAAANLSFGDAALVSLLHFDSSFADETGKHTPTVIGNAQIDTAQSVFGGASALFDGTGDGLQFDGSDDFAFGTGDFTIDFRLRLSGTLAILYDSRPAAPCPTIYVNSTIRYYDGSGDVITGSALSTGTFYHIALTRAGTSTRLFVDGVQVGSTFTDTNNYVNSANRPLVGTGAADLNGSIDELRVLKGRADWTANFTPPSAPYSAANAPTLSQTNLLSASPAAASLALSGQTPVRSASDNRAPTVASLALSGQTPISAQNLLKIPTAAALTLSGQTPVSVQSFLDTPTVAALALAADAPGVAVAGPGGVSYTPTVASLALAATAPARIIGNIYSPASASLAVAGTAPVIAVSASAIPAAANLALSTTAPNMNIAAAGYAAGVYDETGTISSLALGATQRTEIEFGLQLDPGNLIAGDTLSFRVYRNGQPLEFYVVTPQSVYDVAAWIPASASLSLSTAAPVIAIAQNVVCAPAVGSLTLSGVVPFSIQNLLKTPAVASLALSTAAPASVQDLIKVAAASALTLSGQTPASVQDLVKPPAGGTLALSGQVPARSIGDNRTPTVASLALSGQTPASVQNLIDTPAVAALALAGQTATSVQNIILTPAVAALTLAGAAPAISAITNLQPAAAALTISGTVSAILQDWPRTPAVASLTLTALPPIASATSILAPVAAVLSLAGSSPNIGGAITSTSSAAVLTLSGQTPIRSQAFALAPASASLAIAASTPIASVDVRLSSVAATLALTAPIASVGFAYAPSVASLTLAGQTPVRVQAFVLAPSTSTLTLTGIAPSILVNYALTPTAGVLAVSAQAPLYDRAAIPPAAALALSGTTASLSFGAIKTPAVASLAVSGATPILNFSINARPVSGALALTAQAPLTLPGLFAFPASASLTLIGTPVLNYSYGPSPTAAAAVLASVAPSIQTGYLPSATALALSGATPISATNYRQTPASASLTVSGSTAAVFQNLILVPAAASLALSPTVPAAVQNRTVAPTVGLLALTGTTPSLPSGLQFVPAATSATLAGQVPLTHVNRTIAPVALALSTAPPRSVLDLIRQPPAGSIILSSAAASVRTFYDLRPASAALTVSANAPIVSTMGESRPASASLGITAQAPSAVIDLVKRPTAGSIIVTGVSPVAKQSIIVSPAAASLALTVDPATIAFGEKHILLPSSQLALSADAPHLFIHPTRWPQVLDFVGRQPSHGMIVGRSNRASVIGKSSNSRQVAGKRGRVMLIGKKPRSRI